MGRNNYIQTTEHVQGELQPLLSSVENRKNEVTLKKELGLLNGVAIIVGCIVGAGIFVSPKGVLKSCGSIGVSLCVWGLCGTLSMVGALCYSELGTAIPKSGGDYAYIYEAYGALPAFLYLWVALVVFSPTGNAISALTFSNYVLQPVFPTCDPPLDAVRLLAAVVVCLLTFVNCYDVKWATRVQNVFTFTKILALLTIIVTGVVFFFLGDSHNFDEPFQGTTSEPAMVALAFYSGLFSFAGWNYLNFVTEELKDPYKNLPRAILISLPLVTLIYVLTNFSYMVVLSPTEILSSNAVAVTFAERVLGRMAWVMPLFVACSTFGGLNGGIFAASRLFFVGARQGHLPDALAMINVDKCTPVPSLIFLGIITLAMVVSGDVYSLINYTSFVEASFTTVSVTGLLRLRWSRPDLKRPIKVNIFFPIIFLITCTFLVGLPIYSSPGAVGIGILITLTGIPVYLIGVRWKNKPDFILNFIEGLTRHTQIIFNCVRAEPKFD